MGASIHHALAQGTSQSGNYLRTFLNLGFNIAHAAGYSLTGMTDYMFEVKYPLFTRGLSLFHFWLPLVLLWIVARLGYDRRAFVKFVVSSVATTPFVLIVVNKVT